MPLTLQDGQQDPGLHPPQQLLPDGSYRSVLVSPQGTYTTSDAVPSTFTLTSDNGQTVTCTTG